ncbi:MAG TPA: HEAT repeat domain-containing protein [Chthonomonadales bacterium]|nr:HEAT repeat domain-containing protein [Chthonomonadales bacterium]
MEFERNIKHEYEHFVPLLQDFAGRHGTELSWSTYDDEKYLVRWAIPHGLEIFVSLAPPSPPEEPYFQLVAHGMPRNSAWPPEVHPGGRWEVERDDTATLESALTQVDEWSDHLAAGGIVGVPMPSIRPRDPGSEPHAPGDFPYYGSKPRPALNSDFVLPQLRGPFAQDRAQTAIVLGNEADPSVLPSLEAILEDQDRMVR